MVWIKEALAKVNSRFDNKRKQDKERSLEARRLEREADAKFEAAKKKGEIYAHRFLIVLDPLLRDLRKYDLKVITNLEIWANTNKMVDDGYFMAMPSYVEDDFTSSQILAFALKSSMASKRLNLTLDIRIFPRLSTEDVLSGAQVVLASSIHYLYLRASEMDSNGWKHRMTFEVQTPQELASHLDEIRAFISEAIESGAEDKLKYNRR